MVVGLLPKLTMLRANNAHLGMNTSIDGLGIIILISMDLPGLCDDICYVAFLGHIEPITKIQYFWRRAAPILSASPSIRLRTLCTLL